MPDTMTAEQFQKISAEAYEARLKSGLRSGPVYQEPESAPLVWYDQLFQRGFEPSGTVACEKALRVGGTQNGLDVILVASHANAGALSIPAAATITLTTLQGDTPDGPFTEVGPSICVVAPSEGISCDPDQLAARFAIGNFRKPWLKVKLEFSGAITGGKVDCALGYVPR